VSAEDLRARIADVLSIWFRQRAIICEHARLIEFADAADIVMVSAVQPELDAWDRTVSAAKFMVDQAEAERDAKDAEIGRLAIGHEALNRASIEALERAERAEAERDQLRDQFATAVALIRELADPEPCEHFDHHGYCQTHNLGSPCEHAEAQKFLAALDQAPAADSPYATGGIVPGPASSSDQPASEATR
jgi:hypothetical protein